MWSAYQVQKMFVIAAKCVSKRAHTHKPTLLHGFNCVHCNQHANALTFSDMRFSPNIFWPSSFGLLFFDSICYSNSCMHRHVPHVKWFSCRFFSSSPNKWIARQSHQDATIELNKKKILWLLLLLVFFSFSIRKMRTNERNKHITNNIDDSIVFACLRWVLCFD